MDNEEKFPQKGGSIVEFPDAKEELWLCADESHEHGIRELLSEASAEVSPYGILCKQLLDGYSQGNTDELIIELPFGRWPHDFANQISGEWQPHIFLAYLYAPFKTSAWAFIWLPTTYSRNPKILMDVLYALAKHDAPWLVDEVISGRLELPKGVSLSTSVHIERRLCPIQKSLSPAASEKHPIVKLEKRKRERRATKYDQKGLLIPLLKKIYSPPDLPSDSKIARQLEAELDARGLPYGKDYMRQLIPTLLQGAFGIHRR